MVCIMYGMHTLHDTPPLMKQKNINPAASEHFVEKIAALWPALKGSLAQVRKPCIRPNCRACACGEKHPNYLLAYTSDGRRRCMYVPLAMVPILERALENGRKLERLLSEMGPALIRHYRKENPAQTGPGARLTSKSKKMRRKS